MQNSFEWQIYLLILILIGLIASIVAVIILAIKGNIEAMIWAISSTFWNSLLLWHCIDSFKK